MKELTQFSMTKDTILNIRDKIRVSDNDTDLTPYIIIGKKESCYSNVIDYKVELLK